ncbi:MAG: peptidase dimerization domain-containing protein, partial [Gammaproteobacteria bacterium]|nr:peptidase dimerization domain-containing protein [Gemmatimonadota bacterium]NIU72403.1 peptidase dimerization domain-containing protein [Gammaproteobacteria bacterium]
HASVGMQAVLDAGVRADAAIVCEPTSLAIMPAHKGFAWIQVVFRGRAAHGSRPDLGVDAIRHAGRFLARLDRLDATLLERPAHALLAHGSIHAGTI